MSLPSSYLRPELAALAPYNAGLTVAEVASRPGVTRVAKLGSNENPLGPDPAVRQALEAALQRIAVYPDPVGRTLVAKLAARHGIAARDRMQRECWATARRTFWPSWRAPSCGRATRS